MKLRHALYALSFLTLACGDSGSDADQIVLLKTFVDRDAATVGEQIEVRCHAYNQDGELISEGPYPFAVSPAEATEVDGRRFSSTLAGRHEVSCYVDGVEVAYEESAEVTFKPGAAVATAIDLVPAEVVAGGTTEVDCRAVDAYGNATGANLGLRVAPRESVDVEGLERISTTVAGTYEVSCYGAGVPEEKHATAAWTVVAGEAVGFGLGYVPSKRAYERDESVRVVGRKLDAYGNAHTESLAIKDLAVSPSEGSEVWGTDRDRLLFKKQGVYEVSAKVGPDEVPAVAPIVIDDEGPEITIFTPERGLVTDSPGTVTLSGEVSDRFGDVAKLLVNGTSIPVPPEGGAFTAEMPLDYGLNLWAIEAEDSYGNRSLRTRAVEKSSDYYAMEEPNADQVRDAIALIATQDFFDDGDREATDMRTMARLLEFIVANLDIKSFFDSDELGSFSCAGGACRLVFESVTMDDVEVTLNLATGYLEFEGIVNEFSANLAFYFPGLGGEANVPIHVTAERLTLDSDVYFNMSNGQLQVETRDTEVEIIELDLVIDDPTGIAQALSDMLMDRIRATITASLQRIFVDLIEEQLGDAMGGFVDALNIEEEFEVPSPVPSDEVNTLILKANVKGVDIDPHRMEVRVDGKAYAQNPQRPHETLGSIDRSGCAYPEPMGLPDDGVVKIGIHDNFINQLAFGLWEGGTLSMNLDPETSAELVGSFGLTDATIVLDALLPPVYNSCATSQNPGDERLQLGDLYVDLIGNLGGLPVSFGMWVAAEAAVELSVIPNEEGGLDLKFDVGAIDPLWIDLERNEGAFEGDSDAIVDLVETLLVPQLLSAVEESARFSLPVIDLGEMTDAVPAGTIINLDIREILRDGQFLSVQGGLQ